MPEKEKNLKNIRKIEFMLYPQKITATNKTTHRTTDRTTERIKKLIDLFIRKETFLKSNQECTDKNTQQNKKALLFLSY